MRFHVMHRDQRNGARRCNACGNGGADHQRADQPRPCGTDDTTQLVDADVQLP